jgi:hypothetical protein
MAGFDNGTSQGVFFQAKQFGAILRGFGPPVPQAGVVGDVYIDNLTFQLYEKRSPDAGGDVDPWGHYIFVVPATYRTSLKWFGATPPTNDVGNVGDYFLHWAGYPNYGVQPAVYGPKVWGGWPNNGDGPGTVVTGGGSVLPRGLLADGATVTDMVASSLIAEGLLAETVIPVPVTAADNDPVLQLGAQSGPTQLSVTLNSLYTAEDSHAI